MLVLMQWLCLCPSLNKIIHQRYGANEVFDTAPSGRVSDLLERIQLERIQLKITCSTWSEVKVNK